MRLFNAGLYASNFEKSGRLYYVLNEGVERGMRDRGGENCLESYHYIHKESIVAKIRRDGVKVFLDSGAFSAYTQGVTIDIGRYCEYIQRNADIIEQASVLDAIGDYKGTWKNQADMERRGVKPLPCYHYGEPTEVLDYYVANYDYITIGGMVPISTAQLKIWLDRIWAEHLTHPDGKPKVQVHGFGLTSLPLMMRYPWYSVDSSTWVQWGARGMILLPGFGQLDISSRSSARKYAGKHVDNLAPVETDAIETAICNIGGDPQRLRDVYITRWAWNAWAFPEYAATKHYENDKFETVEQRIF